MPSLADLIIAKSFTKAQALADLSGEQRVLEEKVFIKETKDVDTNRIYDEAREAIEKVPELIIRTALPLSETEVSELGRKVRELFQKKFFIDVKPDPGLIGGAALVWKGQYRDYSLRARLEEKKAVLLGIYDQFAQDRRGRIRPGR